MFTLHDTENVTPVLAVDSVIVLVDGQLYGNRTRSTIRLPMTARVSVQGGTPWSLVPGPWKWGYPSEACSWGGGVTPEQDREYIP